MNREMALSQAETEVAEGDLILRAFTATNLAMMITNLAGTICAVNPAFTTVTGWTQEEVLGKRPSMLQSGRHNDEFYKLMWQSLESEGNWEGEIWNQRKDGQHFMERLTINSIYDEGGARTHYVAVFNDVTARKTKEQQLYTVAHQDALTGLPNRLFFDSQLESAIALAQRKGRIGAVALVDLDGFKDVNDRMGHGAGDSVLRLVAKRLTASLRKSDVVARHGGDEFIILLPEIEKEEDSIVVANTLLTAFEDPIVLDSDEIKLSVSVGICLFPTQGTVCKDLVEKADFAMHRAKAQGKGTYNVYEYGLFLKED